MTPKKSATERTRTVAYSDLLAALDGLTSERAWSLEGAWEGAPIVVMAAPEKALKSWAECDLARAVITGDTWLGAFNAVSTGDVVFIEDENGAAEIARRVARLARGTGQDPREILPRLRHYYATDVFLSKDCEALTRILQDCKEDPPAQIIMGPFRNLVDGDENSNTDVIRAFNILARIRDVAGCAVFLDHHLNKSGQMTGARAMKTRSDLFLEGSDEDVPRYAVRGRTVRTKDRIAKPFVITIEHENDDDDTVAKTLLRARFEGEKGAPLLSSTAKAFLAVLRKLDAPASMSKLRGFTGTNGTHAPKALEELRKAGLAQNDNGRWSLSKKQKWSDTVEGMAADRAAEPKQPEDEVEPEFKNGGKEPGDQAAEQPF